ncbi:uracil-DNA glycosylase [Mycoplasmoides pirum]|uniref:uracil-DNA glycosylase n=1 Tax=Mycoplasmoides pirum TaxID=2122 RepID=UPI000485951D|nr:uracil-DNA glycosylase [Mycoplasmoides pirum]
MLTNLIKNLNTNWRDSLLKQINYSYFDNLNKIVTNSYLNNEVFPKKENIFNAFNFFNVEETKVVIIGQDPYHNNNQANGLAFGINPNCKFPPSLSNIAIELKNDLNVELKDYSLVSWAKQKILLLNTNLTVMSHKPLSHSKIGWENLIINELKYLLTVKPNVIFVSWGQHAKKIIDLLNVKYLVSSAHPSPFSAHNFFNTKPFSKINNFLLETRQAIINW